jgi:iron complex transport system substrate-binding protein
MRIASLLPAATEIVAALGRAEDLVAVTFECDVPAGIRERAAVVVDTALPPGLDPGAIDAVVRDRVARGLPMYELDRAALAGLAPELLLTQDLCRVCALSAGTVEEALQAIGCSAEVVSIDPHGVEDVLAAIGEVGRRAGAAPAAGALVGALHARLAAVEAAVAGRGRPRVLVLEWTDPPFLAGHWVPELVRRAGGEPVGGADGGRCAHRGLGRDRRAAGGRRRGRTVRLPARRRRRAGRGGPRPVPRRAGGGDRLRGLRGARRAPAGRRGAGAGLGTAPRCGAAAARGPGRPAAAGRTGPGVTSAR